MTTEAILLPYIHSYLEKWAYTIPDGQAVIQHEENRILTFRELDELVDLYALRLMEMNMQKGDRIAGVCLHSIQYLALQFACFKTGVIICPIDIKLKAAEIILNIKKIAPRLLFILTDTNKDETKSLVALARTECPFLERILQFRLKDDDPMIEGAEDGNQLFQPAELKKLARVVSLIDIRNTAAQTLSSDDVALIIFTTGTSSGDPKPAMLHHECVVAQLEISQLTKGQRGQELRMMCSLPDSHVGGTTIQPYSAIYSGGTAIMVYRFSPKTVLEAMERWRATWFGAVPTMFRLLWSQPDYHEYDLSSLDSVKYAGSIVSVDFLRELSKMAPRFGTTLGMTETAGCATVTPYPITPEELAGQVGMASPVAEISVREPMKPDGSAGDELPLGEIGEICYHPPLVFKGYFGMPKATAEAVSTEGILYSGDIGYFQDKGSYHALYFKGRRKFMIKQKGYNVFPDEVSGFINQMDAVENTVIVGADHDIFDEGIVAFVKPRPGMSVSAEEVLDYCHGIASWKRPQLVVVLKEGETFPINRVEKIDIVCLTKRAEEVVKQEREKGRWDARKIS